MLTPVRAIPVSICPWPVDPVVLVISTCVMANPPVPIHVRIFRMTIMVAIIMILIVMMGVATILSRPMSRRISPILLFHLPRRAAVRISMMSVIVIIVLSECR
jgi:hypothetical protein